MPSGLSDDDRSVTVKSRRRTRTRRDTIARIASGSVPVTPVGAMGMRVALWSRRDMAPSSDDHPRARLLALFQRLALLAAPLTPVSWAGCGPCSAPEFDQIFLLKNPDAETQALVDACRASLTHDCTALCAKVSGKTYFDHCELHPDRDGYMQVHVGQENRCPGGRRPQRLLLAATDGDASSAGALFARQFQLEAASVPAFCTLARELCAWGAPPKLCRAAQAAARDEVRHARAMATLSRRYGGRPRPPAVAPTSVRTLVDFAVENAVEGCVRETYGALLAAVQARRSCDATVRRMMEGIAADEARHAALGWAVDDWLRTRLSMTERAALDDARASAIDELHRDAGADWSPSLDRTAGLPPVDVTRALLDELRRTVWA